MRSIGPTLFALALLAPAASCKKHDDAAEEKQPPVEVECAPARRTTLDRTLLLRGRMAAPPGGDLGVAAQVAGRVVETKVKEGDHVKKGAVVAIVDDLAPRAAAKQADATLARARSAAVNAELVLNRTKNLAAQGLASKADVDDATAKAEAARAEVEADVAATKLASGTLGRVDVRSDFEGVVTKIWRGPGAIVDGTGATPIVELATTSAIEFVADATDRDLATLKEGQRAIVTTSSGARIAGTVIARSRALDATTGLGQVRVHVDGPAPPEEADEKGEHDEASAKEAPFELPPLGSFGKVVVALGKQDGALAIPVEALRGAALDGAEIAICKGEEAEIRAVSVGYRDRKIVEIVSGLKDGEEVATGHVLGLESGTKITRAKAEKKGEEKEKDHAPSKEEGAKKDPR